MDQGVPIYAKESTIALWSIILIHGTRIIWGGVGRVYKKERRPKNQRLQQSSEPQVSGRFLGVQGNALKGFSFILSRLCHIFLLSQPLFGTG